MDRLEAMSILVAAVETGSFSAAGRRLGTPLPTISRKVSELESHLNTRLLLRTTRKLTLTDAGVSYLAACRQILEQVGDAERAAAGEYLEPRGSLVITAPIVFGRWHMLPLVNDFLAAYPDIVVRLVLSDRTLHLTDDHVDVALRIGTLPDSSMVASRVGYVGRIVCGSPGLFTARTKPRTPNDLAGFPCVSFETPAPETSWSFPIAGRRSEQAAPIRTRLSVNTAEAAIDAAVAGVGLTRVLSYQAARAIAQGTLQRVLAKFEPDPIPVNLMHAGQGLLPLKTRRFLEFAAPRLREVLTTGARAARPAARAPRAKT